MRIREILKLHKQQWDSAKPKEEKVAKSREEIAAEKVRTLAKKNK